MQPVSKGGLKGGILIFIVFYREIEFRVEAAL